jgi:hypothetical protein
VHPKLGNPAPRIELFQVTLHRRAAGDPMGLIGIDAFAGRFSQDARVRARLSRPAYCFLIALNPDGAIQLCSPETPATAPAATTAIDYPPDPGSGFALTDGVGTQAFVLVASAKPLPPYAEWSRKLGELPWKAVSEGDVWRYDGRTFDRDIRRGDVRPLADLPPPLEAACRALQAGPGIETIRALAFPVQPQQKVGPAGTGHSPGTPPGATGTGPAAARARRSRVPNGGMAHGREAEPTPPTGSGGGRRIRPGRAGSADGAASYTKTRSGPTWSPVGGGSVPRPVRPVRPAPPARPSGLQASLSFLDGYGASPWNPSRPGSAPSCGP